MIPCKIIKLITVATLALASPLLAADKTWMTNDGDWQDANAWDPSGAPLQNDGLIQFGIVGESTAPEVNVTVSAANSYARLLRLGNGKTLNVHFTAGSSLSADGNNNWQINTGFGAGAGSSHLNFFGPENGTATLTLAGLMSNANQASAADGNTVSFSGPNLRINSLDGSNSRWVIGRWSNHNEFALRNKASADVRSILISQNAVADLSNKGNRLIIDDANLTISGSSSYQAIAVGMVSGEGSDVYEGALHDNSVQIRNNGRLDITARRAIQIGAAKYARSNYIEVTEGAQFSNTGGGAISIGNSDGDNLGGNRLTVGSNGRISTTTNTTIHKHDASGRNDGANRLVIKDGGTFAGEGQIINRGLLQLHEGGALMKIASSDTAPLLVRVEEGARFEAAGSGLAESVEISIRAGGIFTTHLEDATEAQTFTTNSRLVFDDESIYEVALFGASNGSLIHLEGESAITLSSSTALRVILKDYAPVAGDSWTLFSGNTTNIIGDFALAGAILPDLGSGLTWDLSGLNETGGWRVAVAIPEARTTTLVFSGIAFALLFLRKRAFFLHSR